MLLGHSSFVNALKKTFSSHMVLGLRIFVFRIFSFHPHAIRIMLLFGNVRLHNERIQKSTYFDCLMEIMRTKRRKKIEMKTRQNSSILIMLMASNHCVLRCIVIWMLHIAACRRLCIRVVSVTFDSKQWKSFLSGKPCRECAMCACVCVCTANLSLTYWLILNGVYVLSCHSDRWLEVIIAYNFIILHFQWFHYCHFSISRQSLCVWFHVPFLFILFLGSIFFVNSY